MFRANNFDKLLDKATSNLRLDPDWPTILQICDLIRQNDCSPKYAVAAVKKKLYSQNPHQAMFALLTLESIVKNCGSGIHDEVASKVFCEMLRDLVKTTQHENLRTKILELIQAWAFAFRNIPKYRAVQDTVNILKAEGYKFPALKESDAMFSADTAPEWADGEVCHRCRVAFTLMVRRHHCRACGQVFCQQCSSKTSTLPKFGIEKEVRVCDACFDKVSRPPSSTAKLEIADSSSDYVTAPPQKKPGKTAEELQEEEELQLALALSQSEAEQKEKERHSRSHIAPDTSLHPTVSPTPSSVSASPEHNNAASSELSRYLDRNYWEQRMSRDAVSAPTAPSSHGTHDSIEDFTKPAISQAQEDDAEDKEVDVFVESLKSQVEIFVNRMKSNSSRGRSIANDTAVQTLFMNITAMHSRLLRYIQQQDDKRVYLESLQDKVNQIRDSRAALDTLRAEHAARIAQAAEAAERQRQMQMAAKLQAMRKKKHEYLQYQRQLALQRVQEQEREMQMRQEQQKHQYMMSANSGYYMPGVSMHQFQTGYPNQPMYANPQYHPQMAPQPTTDGTVPMPGQPQLTQGNVPMTMNQMGPMSQSMPQMTNSYSMSTISQPTIPTPQAATNQPNARAAVGPQMPMPQQMMMHQMRMPMQPGVHQMMPPNVANGLAGQPGPQSSQSAQMPKQNLPSQGQQQQNAMLPPMSMGQQLNPHNPMLGMQMQSMRMPLMGNQTGTNQQVPVTAYQLNMNQANQQNQPGGAQIPNMQGPQMQRHSMQMPGQPMMQGQLPGQNMSMPNHLPPTSQGMLPQGAQTTHSGPQLSQQSQIQQGQNNPMQGVPVQAAGQQMLMQGHQMHPHSQNIPQQNMQAMNQGQQMPPNQIPGQGQQIPPNQIPGQGQQVPPHQITGQGQHMPPHQLPGPGQQMPSHQIAGQGQQMPPHQVAGQVQQMPPNQLPGQGQQVIQRQQIPNQMMPGMAQMAQAPMQDQMPQQVPSQGQQLSQTQQIPQNLQSQQMKIQQQTFPNGPSGPPAPNQQTQTPAKSEHNNNTAELISFD